MNTETLTVNHSTCVVRARDFSHDTTDRQRDEWTAGKLRHLIAALGDTPVIVTTEARTGHTEVNVVLVGIRSSFTGHPEVGVRSTFADGSVSVVWHLAFMIGDTIIPLVKTEAKWVALKTYGDEQSAAIQSAQAEHGEAEGRAWGEWVATPGRYEVAVTYTPATTNPAFKDKWGERGWWTYPTTL